MHGGAFLYQRHTQPGTSENQRQGETEEENCDYQENGDDNECRRFCSDGFVYEYLSKHRDDQKNVVKLYATQLLLNLYAN